MSDSLWPNGLQHTRLPCPSPSPRVCKNSCPLSPWSHPTILSPVVPFSSCLQSFLASGSFPMSQLFASGGQSIAIQLQHVQQTGGWTATLPSQLMSPHLPYLWKPDFQEGSGTKVSGVWASPGFLRSVGGGARRSTPTPLPTTVTPATPSQTTVGSLTQASWAHSTNSCFSQEVFCFHLSLFKFPFLQVSLSQFYQQIPSQFSSVVSDSLQPHGLSTPGLPVHHQLPEPAQTHVHWISDAIQSSHPVVPFSSCLQSFPVSGSFPMTQFFTSGGQSIRVSASASVLPMNIQDWFPWGWTGWISLQSKGLSRVFPNTTVQKHQFFGVQLSL